MLYLEFISWIAKVLFLKHDFVVHKSLHALNYFIHIFYFSLKSLKFCWNKSMILISINKSDNHDLEMIP